MNYIYKNDSLYFLKQAHLKNHTLFTRAYKNGRGRLNGVLEKRE
jgi:hypothetical protein